MPDQQPNDPIDVTTSPAPIRMLDAGSLLPEGMRLPCPARVVAHLGFERGVTVPCDQSAGHEGWHRYHIEWRQEVDS